MSDDTKSIAELARLLARTDILASTPPEGDGAVFIRCLACDAQKIGVLLGQLAKRDGR